MELNGWRISRHGDKVWITSPEGEAMAVTAAEFEKLIAEYFRAKF
jgi:hypothetical protein